MKCRQPGCTGTIVDGYCDVCGMPAPTMPVGQGTPGARPAEQHSGRCTQPGCQGWVVDGYCDVCGAPPGTDMVPTPSGITRASIQLGSAALGSARASSFGESVRRRRRRTTTAGRLGAGLIQVPPAPAIDPSRALMVDPVVPPERRTCPRCGTKVGQQTAEGEGRNEGFCPNCRAPYSFGVKLHPGDVVAGQYRVEGALAHGGMGWIYLASDNNVSGRWVVLKGLLNTGDSDALAATISEQQFLARVEHPLIVEIYNFVSHAGAGYIVMEWVGGRSLKQLLKQRMEANGGQANPLPVEMSLAFLIEILPAFSYLHELGLLYCDFKPDNIIQVGDSVKLIDLGGVRHIDDDESAIYGTIGFQAPEVATAGASIASDIYTIGRTLLVLSADVPGYQTEFETSLPPVEQLPQFAAHDSAYRLLAKCCEVNPDDRFASAEELRVQALGVLREVAASRTPGFATTAAASALFESPTASGAQVDWRQLPRLRVDAEDPQAPWLARLSLDNPSGALEALANPPALTPAVLLARGMAGLETGRPHLAQEALQRVLAEDPWEWRAIWLAGLVALEAGDTSAAQASFNAVYGQVPGELAPKLALALACELGEQTDLAESLYQICASTDAAYATPAAFGLARTRLAKSDTPGALAALALVPATSRGYPESQRFRTSLLVEAAADGQDISAALNSLSAVRLDAAAATDHEISLYRKALTLPDPGKVVLAGSAMTTAELRRRLEAALRRRAAVCDDPGQRADLIDNANEIRPWSLL